MATAGQFTTGRFELAIDGHSLAVFSELQGISPVSHRNVAPVTLTLRRGKTNDMQLFVWHRSGMRKNGTLAIYGAAGAPIARYRLTNAAATECRTVHKFDSFTLKQKTAQVQTEEITIVVERLDRH
ncbi:MAG: hypothetical protein GEV13_25030 [Rhodospirillales bacterium]|nr:hypothetical protein [Rhodospirillales bacterium]